MPYVKRDANNDITALYARPQPGTAEERLEDDHPDVVAFRIIPETPDPDAELAQAIADATTLDELKDALLGTLKTGQGGRVAARAKP